MMKQFFYTKTETDTKLSEKSSTNHTHVEEVVRHQPVYNSSFVNAGTSYFARKGDICTFIFSFSGSGGAFTQANTWYSVTTGAIPTPFRPVQGGLYTMCPAVDDVSTGGMVGVFKEDGSVRVRLNTAGKKFQFIGTLTYVCNGNVVG